MCFVRRMTMLGALLVVVALEANARTIESASSASWTKKNRKSSSQMFEYFKFDGNPTFNVIAKTRKYTDSLRIGGSLDESLYDNDYVLRGSPPIVVDGLGIRDTYPTNNMEITSFGHTIDRENPYRCFYFQRWRKVRQHDDDGNDLDTIIGDVVNIIATIIWTPEGKIVYEQIGTVVIDHLEVTTTAVALYNSHNITAAKRRSRGKKLLSSFIQRLKNLLATDGGDNNDKGRRLWSQKKREEKEEEDISMVVIDSYGFFAT